MRFLDPKNLNMISIDQQKGGCYIMMSVLSELPIQKSMRVMQTPYFQTSWTLAHVRIKLASNSIHSSSTSAFNTKSRPIFLASKTFPVTHHMQ